jgi:hypothetical protein
VGLAQSLLRLARRGLGRLDLGREFLGPLEQFLLLFAARAADLVRQRLLLGP